MSNLLVQNIKHTNGTSAQTVDSSGRVHHPNTVVCDLWRLGADFSSSAATITGWQRPTESDFAYIAPSGTGMTQSSGIFTFPFTGVYLITAHAQVFLNTADQHAGMNLQISIDSGSNFNIPARTSSAAEAASNSMNGSGLQYLCNVTNVSQTQVKFVTVSFSSGALILGASTTNYTSVYFERKGPSQ